MGSRHWWTIVIGTWGTKELLGTMEDAEAYRVHKANWEPSPAVLLRGRKGKSIRGKVWQDILNHPDRVKPTNKKRKQDDH